MASLLKGTRVQSGWLEVVWPGRCLPDSQHLESRSFVIAQSPRRPRWLFHLKHLLNTEHHPFFCNNYNLVVTW